MSSHGTQHRHTRNVLVIGAANRHLVSWPNEPCVALSLSLRGIRFLSVAVSTINRGVLRGGRTVRRSFGPR